MGRPTVDLTGKQFGRLLVLRRAGNARSGDALWECQCSCPDKTILTVTSTGLRSGKTKSCGCWKTEVLNRLKNDLTGKRFGRLTVLRRVDNYRKSNCILYECECSCENKTKCVVDSGSLTSGHTQSCGCLRLEKVREVCGKWFTLEDKQIIGRFNGMIQRCYNKNCDAYPEWGGRGIYICDEWLNDPEKFVEWSKANGFKPDLWIDRIDNNGPYAPWNCRWVDQTVQANNKRTNHYVDIDGTRHTVAEWARLAGLDYFFLIYKLKRGYELFRDIVLYNLSQKRRTNCEC